jgi:hypothetical protein
VLGVIDLVTLFIIVGLVSAIFGTVILVPAWRILTKIGYPGWYGFIFLVPVVNVIALWVFAFSTWPSQRSLSQECR